MKKRTQPLLMLAWTVFAVMALESQPAFAQQAARQPMVKSPYWDKPLALPPSPDELIPKLSPLTARWLAEWKAAQLQGRSATLQQLNELRILFKTEPITAARMAQLVHLIAFLDGNEVAVPLCDIVLDHATSELNAFQPGDPLARPTVDAIWPLHHVLWEQSQWYRDQRLIELLRPWETYGSGHSQWVSYVYAEGLYMQGKIVEAYEAFKRAEEERVRGHEPSEHLNRPLYYELGSMAWHAGKYYEAVSHFRAMTEVGGVVEAEYAWVAMIDALIDAGDVSAANATLEEWIQKRRPPASAVAQRLRRMEQLQARMGKNDKLPNLSGYSN